ncbi:MAG: chlorite dismutase, partial [Acidimicrobiales bacterium]|nr:chlorite dismutase [Acidimicrobiales bacterium]
AVEAAVGKAVAEGLQVVPVAVLGHKADLAFMALGPDWWQLKAFQTAVTDAGLVLVDSYVSLT